MREIERKLRNLKRDYQSLNSEYLEEFGWDNLRKRIEGKDISGLHARYQGRFLYITGAVFVLILFSGFVKVASASLPGHVLYPIKRLGEKIYLSVVKKPEMQIENRAEEIINLSKQKEKNEKQMEQALQEYQDSVEKIKKETEKMQEKRQEIKRKIEEQEEKIREVIDRQKEKGDEMNKLFKDKEMIRKQKKEAEINFEKSHGEK